MVDFTRLNLGILVCFFSLTSFANAEQFTVSFSISDYQRSERTGESIHPSYFPVSESSNNAQSSADNELKVDGSDRLTPFIIGGKNASRDEYPEYALVLISNGVDRFIGSCGGTLIADNKVLTAAHCAGLPANRYFIIPNFYSYNDEFFFEDFFPASSIRVHPDYDDVTLDYDMAVITLATNPFTPVASVHAGTNQFVDANATVIGTGRIQTDPAQFSDILQEVDVPVVTNTACQEFYQSIAASSIEALQITPRMICTGYESDGRGSCFGDSGGPLWIDIKDQRVQVGVVSFGDGTCEQNRRSSGYARVSAFTDFLLSASPQTNFVFSDEVPSLAPVYGLLLGPGDVVKPIIPLVPIGPVQQFPVIEEFVGRFKISVVSDSDDYIGQGNTYAYDQSNSNVSVTIYDGDTIDISIDGWGLSSGLGREIDGWSWNMQPSPVRELEAGVFGNITRYPFNDTTNGLSFSGNGRGCNSHSGQFRIFEIEYSGTQVSKLVADFIQRCGDSSAPRLRGSIYYDNSREPLIVSTKAITTEQPVPSLALLSSLSAAVRIQSEVGHPVGGGNNYLFTSANSTITLTNLYGDPIGISLIIQDSTNQYWRLEMMRSTLEANPDHDKPLSRGVYDSTLKTPRNGPEAGLSFSGDGNCSGSITGQFRIFEITYDSNGEVEVLQADFEQYCSTNPAALHGSINYDSR